MQLDLKIQFSKHPIIVQALSSSFYRIVVIVHLTINHKVEFLKIKVMEQSFQFYKID